MNRVSKMWNPENYIDASTIFTPTDFPYKNYVDRPDTNDQEPTYADEITKRLTQEQTIVLEVTGASKTGKTILIEDCLERVKKSGKNRTVLKLAGGDFKTEEEFWQVIAEKLDLEIATTEKSVSGKLSVKLAELQVTYGKTVPVLVIREFVKQQIPDQTIIFIDDFHFIDSSLRRDVVRIIKTLTTPNFKVKGIKVILVFIRTKEIVNATILANIRSTPIRVPLWQPEELRKIALEDIDRSNKNQERNRDAKIRMVGSIILARESFGLPAIMQELCLRYCEKKYPPYGRIPEGETIFVSGDNNDILEEIFRKVADGFWGDDKFLYNELVGNVSDRQIIQQKTGDRRYGSLEQMILYALTAKIFLDPLEGMTLSEQIEIGLDSLMRRLEKIAHVSHVGSHQIRESLKNMRDKAFSLYQERVDEGDGVIDPVFDYDENEEVVKIYSPRFLMALRHSPEHQKRFKKAR